jgi:hypothetical protein
LAPPPRVHCLDVDGVGLYVLYDHLPEILEGGRTHDVMFDTQLNTLVLSPTPSCTPALPNEMAL